jgi:glycosyltransferase involved in cell wall biosynthesis
MKKDRPRIAMLGVGQVGGGILGQGVPVLFEMVKRVSHESDVTFYSLMPVNFKSNLIGLKVHSISDKKISLYIKYILLLIKLIYHHIKKPFNIIFSVSTFPAGRMAVMLARVLRRPVVVQLIADEMVSMPEIEYGELLSPRLRRINKWVCRNANELIVLTEYQKRIVLDNLGESRTIRVMPMRIDVSKFPIHAHELSSKIQFIHVAYYHRVKDQITLFKAFAQISQMVDCELTVVGHGYDCEEVRKMLTELSISNKVHFVGIIMNESLSEIFSRMHILLHTSRYEAECAVVMEAMASGVVVCGTSVGFLSDNEGLSVTVQPAQPAELAKAVLQLLQDPAKYKFLKVKARRYIEENSTEQSSGAYQSLFHHLVYSTGYEKL